jgi:hypothetical protein
MLKTIPKSSVWKRSFPVYKEFEVTDSDYQVISGSLESGLFDTGSFNKQGNFYTHPLIKSINAKYYNQDANAFTVFGDISDITRVPQERAGGNTAYVISLPQEKYGERIKKGSVTLTNTESSLIYGDDEDGNITANVPVYTITDLDFDSDSITIIDSDGETFIGTITSYDANNGNVVLTFGSDTDSAVIALLDLNAGLLQTSQPLDFEGLSIDEARYGNVFYSEGIIVLWDTPITNYNLKYRSTKTIYETEVLVSAKAGEFNYSQNPSAVDVVLSGSYDFTTTAIPNVSPARTIKIKEVTDIKRKSSFSGSYGSSTGSWDDYDSNNLSDPTGSYLSPFITTIGLYDKDGDMVAIAKLPNPIKNLPDMDMNFIVRFDT